MCKIFAIKGCAISLKIILALGFLQRQDIITRKAMSSLISFLAIFLVAIAWQESNAVAKCVGEKCPSPCQGNVNSIQIRLCEIYIVKFFNNCLLSFFSNLQAYN